MLDTLRRWLIAHQITRMTLETLQRRLIKIDGWVRQRPDRVQLRLAISQRSEACWRVLATPPYHD